MTRFFLERTRFAIMKIIEKRTKTRRFGRMVRKELKLNSVKVVILLLVSMNQ